MATDDNETQNSATASDAGSPPLLRTGLVISIAAACIVAGFFWQPSPEEPSPLVGPELLRKAQAAYSVQAFDRVLKHVSQMPVAEKEWVPSRLLAGMAAEQMGDLNAAAEFLSAYPEDGSAESAQANYLLGVVYRQLGWLSSAVGSYQRVLKVQPDHAKANADLGYLMSITGRPWLARKHYLRLLDTESWTLKSLCLLTDPEQPSEHSEYLDYCRQQDASGSLLQLGLAHRARMSGNLSKAVEWADYAVGNYLSLPDTHALLGELLADAFTANSGLPEVYHHLGRVMADGNTPDVQAWYDRLPATADDHAGVWFAKGLLARHCGELKVAARCFGETVRREPNHRRACHQLGQLLQVLKKPGADDFLTRAEELAAVSQLVSSIWTTDAGDPDDMARLIKKLERMDRTEEAWAWATTAAAKHPESASFPELAVRLKSQLDEVRRETQTTSRVLNVALRYDFSDLPDGSEVAWPTYDEDSVAATSVEVSDTPRTIRFALRDDIGINSTYFSAADPNVEGVRYFETTGGGVAVIDIDHDDWPDLYFTQGTEWPHGENQPQPSDRFADKLYRNRNGRFTDVGDVTNTQCRDYGQGCTVGDFNNDGFDDLYVANVGRNRLYCNQGDGTFVEATDTANIKTSEWTASNVMVDLNADGNPELFDVNYVTAPDVYTRICEGGLCGPHAYTGVPDTLHVSNGDGTFTLLPDATPKSDAKGLGVIAAVIDDPKRPSLFVANDAVPNFLLKSHPSAEPANLRFVDNGMLAGVAANGEGSVTGTMGIAADDIDRNGLIDFFVTNFVSESNSLYLQDVPGLFIDATYPSKLHAPSLTKVAWGTQFIDADLDGDADLVIVNGHVDDYQKDEQGYQMPPQFFRNNGRSEFTEVPSKELGPWFDRRFLGRGLARIDYNNDGRMDFVASIVGDPASLLENQTASVGGYLTLRLTASKTARDAIGTQVDVTTASGAWTKQLTAGDGYMASNQRILQFGLGRAEEVSEVSIRWPSGEASTIRGVAANSHLQVTEGIPSATITSQSASWAGSIRVEIGPPSVQDKQ